MRLIKLLKMTDSDNDHEALLAIRKANAELKATNCTWDDVIRVIEKAPWVKMHDHAIVDMLNAVLQHRYMPANGAMIKMQLMSIGKAYQRRFTFTENEKQFVYQMYKAIIG